VETRARGQVHVEVAPLSEVDSRTGDGAATRLRYWPALEAFASSRVPLWLTVWGTLLMMAHFRGPERPDNLFLNGWFRWDAHYYLQIARYGYSNIANDFGQRDTHFWPLFPLLTRLVSFALPGHDLALAAWLLNHALLFGALVLFDDLCRSCLDDEGARLASWLLLIYPFAFYYSAAYSEASFLFWTLAGFYFGRRKRWLVAALAAGCASATRAAGIGAAIALVVLYWEQCRYSFRNVRWDALFLPLGALGAVEYAAILAFQFHDPLAFTSGMNARDWGADVGLGRFLDTLRDLLSPFSRWPVGWLRATDGVHISCLGAAALLTWRGRTFLRPYLVVFCVIELVIASRLWTNAGRYVAPLFPLYMVGAKLLEGRPRLTRFACALLLSFQVLLTVMYANNYWVS
jgi:hypothetical protein